MSRDLAIRGILSNNNDEHKEIKRVIRRIFIMFMIKTKINLIYGGFYL